MLDLLMLAGTLAAFLAAGAFACGCQRLLRRGDDADGAER